MSGSNAVPLDTLIAITGLADPRGPCGVQHNKEVQWNAGIGTVDSSPSGYQPSEGVKCIFSNCNSTPFSESI